MAQGISSHLLQKSACVRAFDSVPTMPNGSRLVKRYPRTIEKPHQKRRLVQTSEGCLKIRRRFAAVYERDIKGNHTRNPTAVKEGNISAHEGDAVAGKALGLGVLIKFFSVNVRPSLSSIHPFLMDK